MKTKSKAKLIANFDLKIGDDVASLSATVPDQKVTACELIPVYQLLANDIVSHSIVQSAKAGKNISCKAGCSACCTQAVPVSELEALHLAKVVNRMPEHRQKRIRQRFADSQVAIATAGLTQPMQEIAKLDKKSRNALGVKYYSLKLDCPFLEDKRCSIYSDRPLECREFVVTSDPKHCVELNPQEMTHLDSKLRLTPVLRTQSQDLFGEKSSGWMLLVNCLDWAKTNKTRLKKKPGIFWLQDLIELATNRKG